MIRLINKTMLFLYNNRYSKEKTVRGRTIILPNGKRHTRKEGKIALAGIANACKSSGTPSAPSAITSDQTSRIRRFAARARYVVGFQRAI